MQCISTDRQRNRQMDGQTNDEHDEHVQTGTKKEAQGYNKTDIHTPAYKLNKVYSVMTHI